MQTHEPLRGFRKTAASSNRKFGLVFSLFFTILGFWPLFHHAGSPRWLFISLAAAFLAAAILRPSWLAGLNRGWFKLGLALNKIVSPVVMAILFFGAVAPLGWYLRRRGEDLLRLKIAPDAATYWIERQPPGPVASSMRKQF